MAHLKITIGPDDVLIVVDVQNAFLHGGGLPVPGGEDIVTPIAERIIPLFDPGRRFATRDFHPRGHVSFRSSYGPDEFRQPDVVTSADLLTPWTGELGSSPERLSQSAGFTLSDLSMYLIEAREQPLFPDHALAGTSEVQLALPLKDDQFVFVQDKGMYPCCDSFSGLADRCGRWLELAHRLRFGTARRAFVCGLAFDYCVGETALDAAKLCGLETFVILDATRSVAEGTAAAMRAYLEEVGVTLITSDRLARANERRKS